MARQQSNNTEHDVSTVGVEVTNEQEHVIGNHLLEGGKVNVGTQAGSQLQAHMER